MNTHRGLCALITVAGLATACGGGTQAPTTPSTSQSFLAGTWTGTLTIEREGEASSTGPTTWTFAVAPGTNLQTFNMTIQSQHAWLPINTTVLVAPAQRFSFSWASTNSCGYLFCIKPKPANKPP